jgi:hypothetical protein
MIFSVIAKGSSGGPQVNVTDKKGMYLMPGYFVALQRGYRRLFLHSRLGRHTVQAPSYCGVQLAVIDFRRVTPDLHYF